MKLTFITFLFISQIGFGQVFSGTQEIDKGQREGAYSLVNSETKFTEKVWQSYMANFGKQITSKNGITIKNAKVESISTEPITLYSKVWKQRDRTHVFVAAITANGDLVTNGHPKWVELEALLNNFKTRLELEEAVKSAENEQNNVTENHKKIVKNGDKLKDRVAENAKEKEKLLKKIEENKIELEKLLTDIETNKKDQLKALEEIEIKKKAVDEARTRLPK
jgi:septal ring factor EnvC (AmiA/AmiB activator)